ncbi:MAG: purine-nucleoside phosphorylase [Planctomycetes bacterium]|nr:purine-nucleoside phosphorylase [Planctomycetota bacterium]
MSEPTLRALNAEILGDFQPEAVFVLGSGLGALAERVEQAQRRPATLIPGVPGSSIVGHSGELLWGTLAGVRVAVLSGRTHVYEGHSMQSVVRAVRVLLCTGPRLLVLTNAAGAIQRDMKPGELMLLADHLNLSGASPLEGPHDAAHGERFPDMSRVYPAAVRNAVRTVADARGLRLREGVYAMLRGPQYETPAEVRMLRILGADAVGMSTVPEAIVASQMGVPVLGVSMLTNLAAGVSRTPLSHAEVLECARVAGQTLADLLSASLPAALAATRSNA